MLVTMQLMVVLVRSSGICMEPAAAKAASSMSTIWSLSAVARMPATHSPVVGSMTLPQALTETTAPTLTGPSATAAAPRPAFMQVAGPMSLPTVRRYRRPRCLARAWQGCGRAPRARRRYRPQCRGARWGRQGEVEDAAGAHDSTCVGPTGKADAAALKLASDAACSLEAKGRSTRKADGVDLVDGVLGTQQVGFARCWSTAANVTPPVAPSGATITVQPVPASSSV